MYCAHSARGQRSPSKSSNGFRNGWMRKCQTRESARGDSAETAPAVTTVYCDRGAVSVQMS
jgi:hypothetical protein